MRLLALPLALCITSPCAASLVPTLTQGVDREDGVPPKFATIFSAAVGQGTIGIGEHHFDQLLRFDLTGPITSLTISGNLANFGSPTALGGLSGFQPGIPVTFGLSVGVASAPASPSAADVAAAVMAATDVGTALVGNGVTDILGTRPGPAFSITLDAAAVAVANADSLAARPFYLAFTGRGDAGFTDNVGGDLTGVVLTTAQAVPEPSTLVQASIAGLIGLGYARRRRGAKAAA